MKVLNMIESAYRGTLEEQDDTIVWLCHAMRKAEADLDVLLAGHAVNYGVKTQDAAGLSFGEERQTRPPRLSDDLSLLIGKGVTVYVLKEDLAERGIEPGELIDGLEPLSRAGLVGLFEDYDQVWRW